MRRGKAGMAGRDRDWIGQARQARKSKTMEAKYARLHNELKRIAKDAPEGKLTAQMVVDAAKNEKSPLHGYFEWDDTEAARKWRLHQARNLIRVVVQPYEALDSQPIHVWQSLVPDRLSGGGYRTTESVLSNEAWRTQLLDQARKELIAVRNKYASLNELAKVWTAIDEGVLPKTLNFTNELQLPEAFLP